MSRPTSQDRVRGCILGAAIGDALGAPWEFKHSSEIRVNRDAYSIGVFNTEPGAATDDSTLLSFHAEAIIKGDVVGEYVKSLIKWWYSNPKDIGHQTSLAILAHTEHRDVPDTGSCGNGSLMAVAPAGLVAKNPIAAGQTGYDFSKLTHPNELCRYACGTFTTAIYEASRTDGNDWHIPHMPTPSWYTIDGKHQGYVANALGLSFAALRRLLVTEEEFVTGFGALEWVIDKGGDTDTNASITGALIGAYFGMAAWKEPAWLVETLQDNSRWFDLADRLFKEAVS